MYTTKKVVEFLQQNGISTDAKEITSAANLGLFGNYVKIYYGKQEWKPGDLLKQKKRRKYEWNNKDGIIALLKGTHTTNHNDNSTMMKLLEKIDNNVSRLVIELV